MTKKEFENLPPDRKMEALNKVIKGELKITDEPDFMDIFGDIFNQPKV
jgi:hypothetical protein